MSEFTPLHDRLLMHQVDTQTRRAATPRTALPRRPRGRHGLALRLHALADRIDG